MAVPARSKNGSRAGGVERRVEPDRPSRHGPLRDWRRAFALVDELKAEYGGAPWFAGVRALRDVATGAIAIHVEAVRPSAGFAGRRITSLPPTLSSRFAALGVRIRLLNGLGERAISTSFGAADAAAAG